MKKAKKRTAKKASVKKPVAKKKTPTAAQLAYYARNKTAAGKRKYANSDKLKREKALRNAGHTITAHVVEEPEITQAQFEEMLNQPLVYVSPKTATAVQEGSVKYIVVGIGNDIFRMEATDSLLQKLALDCLKLIPAPRT